MMPKQGHLSYARSQDRFLHRKSMLDDCLYHLQQIISSVSTSADHRADTHSFLPGPI